MIGLFSELVAKGRWSGTLGADVKTGIAAAGANQGAATALTASVNVVSTVAAGADGVRLPVPGGIGEVLVVVNADAADAVKIYPASGGKINNGSANASVSVAATKSALLVAVSAADWVALVSP